jgi:hypothetical protein
MTLVTVGRLTDEKPYDVAERGTDDEQGGRDQ